MARQGINTGSSPDAGDGDALLIGAIKINNNFDEIYTLLGDGTNLSPGIVTSIVAGTNITVSGSTGQVTINASGSGGSSSQWVSTAAGIHTLSNVGVGTTNPTSKLTVNGNVLVSGVSTFGGYVSVAGTASFTTGVAKGVEFVNESGGGTIRISNDGGNSQGRIGFNGSVNSTLYSNYTNGDINFLVGNDFSLDLGSYGTYALYAAKNGSVSLYNNGSKKFETLGAGVTVTGITFTNELSVSGGAYVSGSVGLGTTNASSKLTVAGDFVSGDPNDGNSQFKVDTVGNASISPGRLLYLNGTNTNVGIRWTSGLGIELYNSSNLGGSDRNVTISSVNGGAVTLVGGGGGTLRINSSGLEVIGVTTSNFSGDVKVGVNTSTGLILTSPNGTQYRLIVDDTGALSTVAV